MLALYLQQGLHLTPLQAGAAFIGMGASYIVTSVVSGRLAGRMGRQVVALGAALMAAGLLLDVVFAGRTVFELELGLIVGGAGMGFVIGRLSGLALSAVRPDHAGAASGVFSMVNQLGGAFGTAAIAGLYYATLAGGGTPAAGFAAAAWALTAVAVAVLLLVQLMPGKQMGSLTRFPGHLIWGDDRPGKESADACCEVAGVSA